MSVCYDGSESWLIYILNIKQKVMSWWKPCEIVGCFHTRLWRGWMLYKTDSPMLIYIYIYIYTQDICLMPSVLIESSTFVIPVRLEWDMVQAGSPAVSQGPVRPMRSQSPPLTQFQWRRKRWPCRPCPVPSETACSGHTFLDRESRHLDRWTH